MNLQLVILGTLAAYVSSQSMDAASDALQMHDNHLENHREEEHSEKPHYNYQYEVMDHHHGDFKQHRESRNGDDVEGFYSVVQPDGTVREVHYTATKHGGFQARVVYRGKPMHDSPKHEAQQHHGSQEPFPGNGNDVSLDVQDPAMPQEPEHEEQQYSQMEKEGLVGGFGGFSTSRYSLVPSKMVHRAPLSLKSQPQKYRNRNQHSYKIINEHKGWSTKWSSS